MPGKSLVEFVGKSRATVMRFIAALKAKGHIEYRGSAKIGGYFITGGDIRVTLEG